MAGRYRIIMDEEPAAVDDATPAPIGDTPHAGRYRIVPEKPILPPTLIGKTEEQQAQQQLKDTAQAREAFDRMELKGRSADEKNILAGAHSFGEGLAPGVFDYIPALGARALGEANVPGYTQYKGMPVYDIKERSRQLGEAASDVSPKAATAGTVGGIGAGIATLPAITSLPKVGKLGTMASGALTGAAYSGVSEGAREGNALDALKGAGAGAVLGGTLSPIAEKVINRLSHPSFNPTGRLPYDPATGQLTREAYDIARSAGLTHEQVSELTPHLLDSFVERGLTKEAAREAPFREFGVTPSRGMVTQNPEQLAKEHEFRDYVPFNHQVAAAAEGVTGGAQPSLRDAIDAAVSRGVAGASALKRQYERAYTTAGNLPGEFDLPAIQNVGDSLLARLAGDPKNLAFRNSDHVVRAAQKLNNDLGTEIATSVGANPTTTIYKNFRAVEEARKGLNSALAAATDKTDRAGMRKLIDEFDKHIGDAINSGAFSGGPDAAAQWDSARKLFAEYQTKYGVKRSGDMSGSLMRDILDNSKTPDQVGEALFRFSQTGDASAKASSLKTFAQLRRALGHNSPEIETIKKSFLQQMMTPGENASPAEYAKVARSIEGFLRGPNASFSRRFLTDTERGMLARYGHMMQVASTKPPDQAAQHINLGKLALGAAPLVLDAALTAAGHISPGLSAITTPASAAVGPWVAKKGSEILAGRAAQAMPKNVSRDYGVPGLRVGIPLIDQAYERTGRATGGRTGGPTAERLIAMSKAARRKIQGRTQAILKQPDDRVVRALKIANNEMQGQ